MTLICQGVAQAWPQLATPLFHLGSRCVQQGCAGLQITQTRRQLTAAVSDMSSSAAASAYWRVSSKMDVCTFVQGTIKQKLCLQQASNGNTSA